jgi:broad specificity phosphatase PhoE
MVCIVMRHGRRGTSVDAPLVGYNSTDPENSSPEIWHSVQQIVQQGALVKQILTSPYLRTRQTALLVQYSYLKLTGNYLPITVDLRLGEYTHRHCRLFTPSIEDFDRETHAHYAGHIPLCRESPDAFLQRVAQFYSQMPLEAVVITHYGVANLLGILAQQEIKLQEGQCVVLAPAMQTQLINSAVP